MNRDAVLGQYIEGNSVIHRLDPRAKITAAILFIVEVFLARNVYAFALLFVSLIVLMALTGIPAARFAGGIKPIIFIMLFTVVINVFWYTGDTLLVDWHFIHIYLEGVINALLVAFRIVILIAGTCALLTYTTTPLALTDGIESLLSPLKLLHVPVHDFSMMMTIALRFIPTLTDEATKIMNAQKARGADFSSGGLFKRARALVPILIPLLVSAFRRAEDLADAMECRCYGCGEKRTRMNVLHVHVSDFVFLALVVLLGAGVIIINKYAPGYSMNF